LISDADLVQLLTGAQPDELCLEWF